MNPSTLRALAHILQFFNRTDDAVSLNQLIARRDRVRRSEIERAWNSLVRLKVLEGSLEREDQNYRLAGLKDGTTSDFLTIWMRKIAKVSSVGHRSVRVAAQVMTLREDVTSRTCGSIVWKERIPMPKYRLPPARVMDPLNGKHVLHQFRIEESRPTHMQFRLDFKPPLAAGRVVEYGFYVWNRNYYSRSREEALRLYKDQWIREGLGVMGPAFDVSIVVRLPENYLYQDCRLEKGTAPSAGGPASPGEILRGLQHDNTTLSATLRDPSPGNYFVSWIPPK